MGVNGDALICREAIRLAGYFKLFHSMCYRLVDEPVFIVAFLLSFLASRARVGGEQ
jgi:hypothetical protein